MNPRAELAAQIAELDQDLAKARASERWTAVASLQNAKRQVLKLLVQTRPPEDDDLGDMTPLEVAQEMALGILETGDDELPILEAALRTRRKQGLTVEH